MYLWLAPICVIIAKGNHEVLSCDTLPIAKILSVKNACEWVSMIFT